MEKIETAKEISSQRNSLHMYVNRKIRPHENIELPYDTVALARWLFI